jgi:pyruvate-ferredoxin/flavodoxin oxidoreductase
VRAFAEAEAYDGPSLIIAYAQCIMHGIDMQTGFDLHRLAVDSGFWPLFRYNPDSLLSGQQPLKLDSKPPTANVEDFMGRQNRFRILRQSDPARAEALTTALRTDITTRWKMLEQWAQFDV